MSAIIVDEVRDHAGAGVSFGTQPPLFSGPDYLHAAFGTGTTTEDKINSTIVTAKASGKEFVLIPDNMIPYEPSLINYDSHVHLVRPKQKDWAEYDLRAYGAWGNNVHDDYFAFKAIYNGPGRGQTSQGGTGEPIRVCWPRGAYRCGRPIETHDSTYTYGENGLDYGYDISWYERPFGNYDTMSSLSNFDPMVEGGVITDPGYAFGPIIYASGALIDPALSGFTQDELPMTDPLIVGASGHSFTFPAQHQFLNLSIAKTMHIDGKSELTVRCFIKPAAATDGAILGIGGDVMHGKTGVGYQGKPMSLFFGIKGGKFAGAMTINGVLKEVTSSVTPVAGTKYHFEMCFNGSDLKLFVEGNLEDTTAAVGTITQDDYEDALFPALQGVGPDAIEGAYYHQAGGASTIYSLDVEDVALHSSSFSAPTARHEFDPLHTLVLLNGDDQEGPQLTMAETKSGRAWFNLQVRNSFKNASAWSYYTDVALLGATGADFADYRAIPYLTQYSGTVTFTRCAMWGFFGVRAIYTANLIFEDCWVTGGATAVQATNSTAIFPGQESGRMKASNSYFYSGRCTLMSNVIRLDAECYVQTYRYNLAFGPGYFFGRTCNNIVVTSASMDGRIETGGAYIESYDGTLPGWRSVIALTTSADGTITGEISGTFRRNFGLVPPITIDGAKIDVSVDSLTVINSEGNFGSLITAITAPNKPVRVGRVAYRLWYETLGVEWVRAGASAGLAVVESVGKGPQIAFSATPSFDLHLQDEIDVAPLTAAVTAANIIHANWGAKFSVFVKQDGTGGHSWTWGTVLGTGVTGSVKGASAIDTVANHWSLWEFEIGRDGNAYQRSFNSGA